MGPLNFYKKDPNKKKRGAGFYYKRRRKYYSKYSIKRDAKKLSGGDSTVGKGKWRHTHDWTQPNKVNTPYGRISESELDIIEKDMRQSEERQYRSYKQSDYYDPHIEDSSLTSMEKKAELKSKLKRGMY